MLTNIIPAAWRQRVYAAYALVIVALGAIAAGFAAAQLSQPSWLIVAGAVLLYVGAAIGATAASNITNTDTSSSSVPSVPVTDTPTAVPVAGDPPTTTLS